MPNVTTGYGLFLVFSDNPRHKSCKNVFSEVKNEILREKSIFCFSSFLIMTSKIVLEYMMSF